MGYSFSPSQDFFGFRLPAPATVIGQEFGPLRRGLVYSTFPQSPQRADRCAAHHFLKKVPVRLKFPALLLLAHLLVCGAIAQPVDDGNLSVNARFLVAARNADEAGIERALAAGANVNSRNRLGESALVILLKNNKVELAQKV